MEKVIFEDSKVRLVQKNGLGFVKKAAFEVQLEKFSAKENVIVLRKRRLFLFMQGNTKMKSFL